MTDPWKSIAPGRRLPLQFDEVRNRLQTEMNIVAQKHHRQGVEVKMLIEGMPFLLGRCTTHLLVTKMGDLYEEAYQQLLTMPYTMDCKRSVSARSTDKDKRIVILLANPIPEPGKRADNTGFLNGRQAIRQQDSFLGSLRHGATDDTRPPPHSIVPVVLHFGPKRPLNGPEIDDDEDEKKFDALVRQVQAMLDANHHVCMPFDHGFALACHNLGINQNVVPFLDGIASLVEKSRDSRFWEWVNRATRRVVTCAMGWETQDGQKGAPSGIDSVALGLVWDERETEDGRNVLLLHMPLWHVFKNHHFVMVTLVLDPEEPKLAPAKLGVAAATKKRGRDGILITIRQKRKKVGDDGEEVEVEEEEVLRGPDDEDEEDEEEDEEGDEEDEEDEDESPAARQRRWDFEAVTFDPTQAQDFEMLDMLQPTFFRKAPDLVGKEIAKQLNLGADELLIDDDGRPSYKFVHWIDQQLEGLRRADKRPPSKTILPKGKGTPKTTKRGVSLEISWVCPGERDEAGPALLEFARADGTRFTLSLFLLSPFPPSSLIKLFFMIAERRRKVDERPSRRKGCQRGRKDEVGPQGGTGDQETRAGTIG